MSEIALFSIGSLIFIATAWATLAFGWSRIHELARQDVVDSPRVREIKDDGLTSVYVTQPVAGEEGRTAPAPPPADSPGHFTV